VTLAHRTTEAGSSARKKVFEKRSVSGFAESGEQKGPTVIEFHG
jgi:hypothetical protein